MTLRRKRVEGAVRESDPLIAQYPDVRGVSPGSESDYPGWNCHKPVRIRHASKPGWRMSIMEILTRQPCTNTKMEDEHGRKFNHCPDCGALKSRHPGMIEKWLPLDQAILMVLQEVSK